MSDIPDVTFDTTDKLELKDFASRLEAFMTTERLFIEGGALVVSLNASFGSGKTTFLEMWKNDLILRRGATNAAPLPIMINAWESDFSGEPLLAIVSGILNALRQEKGEEQQATGRRIKEAALDVVNFSLCLANGFVSSVTGLNPIEAGQYTNEKRAERSHNPAGANLLDAYEKRQKALAALKQALRDAFVGPGLNAIVMVDELDRCRPSYAVEYLEAIKHVFDIKGLAFVLAVDKAQLESSAKALFGVGMNFPEYYRKFAHRNVHLPAPSAPALRRLAEHFVTTVVVSDGEFKRASMLKVAERMDDIVEVITAMNLSPRKVREVFRIIGHLNACPPEKSRTLLDGFGTGGILMAAMSIGLPSLYDLVGSGRAEAKDFRQLVDLFPPDKREWWSTFILTGYSERQDADIRSRVAAFVHAGLLSGMCLDEPRIKEVAQFSRFWGPLGAAGGLRFIHNEIESLKLFAQP